MEDDWKTVSNHLKECERPLKISKEHSAWIKNQHIDVQGRFFELFDKNLHLKELVEKLKYENILANVELTQYKLMETDLNGLSSSSSKFNKDFEKLKRDLEEIRFEKAKLEKELEIKKNRETGQYIIPKWIENAQTKRTEGLGYVHTKHKGKQKKYVDLPRNKVCFFCGKTGHYDKTCNKKELAQIKNAKQFWIKKDDSASLSMEPKETWVPPPNH